VKPEEDAALREHFIDWEAHVFGLGYGTGEEFIIPALKQFLAVCDPARNGGYDHQVLEGDLGPVVAWLLITALVRAGIIEYGSSPRFGWLTNEGHQLRAFTMAHSAEELVEIIVGSDCNRIPNNPDYENEPRGMNPFWKHKP